MNTSPWQPMSTAPQDGTRILCLDAEDGFVAVCSPKLFPRPIHPDGGDMRVWRPGDRWEYFRDDVNAPGHTWSMTPTHWMHIPPLSPDPKPRVTSSDLMRKGGSWIGAARSWMQHRFHNGESVTWGSTQVLTGAPVCVEDIEEVAAIAAAAALNDPPR